MRYVLCLLMLLVPSVCWGAVDFDGTDDSISCANPSPPELDHTFAATIDFDTCTQGGTAISASDKSGFQLWSWFGVGGSSGAWTFRVASRDNDSTQESLESTTTFSGGVHTAVGVRASDTEAEIFIDGASDAQSTSFEMDGTVLLDTITIGALERSSGLIFLIGCQVNEAAIWNRALTDAEAEAVSSGGVRLMAQQFPTSLVGYWTLDDYSDGTSGDGSVFLDRSGNQTCTGNDGANNTGLTVSAETGLSYP